MESTLADLWSLIAVVLIDLALSADNAVAVGLAAAALPQAQRTRAVALGVMLALALRILFGLVAVNLLHVHGLLLLGGLLLLWIAWRMWRDISVHGRMVGTVSPTAEAVVKEAPRGFMRALLSITVANIALSLDNVLAVAGVARNTPAIMVFGLVFSVLLMGVAASVIARLIDRFRWIAMLGVVAIAFAAGIMIWDDAHNFFPTFISAPPEWLGGHANS